MIHERIRTIGYEWVWVAGRYEIELRVYTDLQLDPTGPEFNRLAIDEVVASVRRMPMQAGVIRRVTVVGAVR